MLWGHLPLAKHEIGQQPSPCIQQVVCKCLQSLENLLLIGTSFFIFTSGEYRLN